MTDTDALSRGEALFRREGRFVAGADVPDRIPSPTLTEIAFAGRSNVGKSSLINALVDHKGLARSSNTPGRTQQINFFDIGGKFYLVDLPGYGYASAQKSKVEAWNDMVSAYLRGRLTLKRACVLIDARHGIKAVDQDAMEMLDAHGVPYVVVLTKADKVKPTDLTVLIARIEEELQGHPSAAPKVFSTSSDKKTGIPELRAFLAVEIR